MASVTEFLRERLKLKVNPQKSAVGQVSERKFLGHRLLSGGKLGVAPQSEEELKSSLKELMGPNTAQSMPVAISEVNQRIGGWIQHFHMAQMKGGLMQDIGQWLTRRLRCLRLKRCKLAYAMARFLMGLGAHENSAWMLALSGK